MYLIHEVFSVSEDERMAVDNEYVKNGEGKIAVPCQVKMSVNCDERGEFCENEEEARDWVEDECWLFSGEGFLCPPCNEQVIWNLRAIRPKTAR